MWKVLILTCYRINLTAKCQGASSVKVICLEDVVEKKVSFVVEAFLKDYTVSFHHSTDYMRLLRARIKKSKNSVIAWRILTQLSFFKGTRRDGISLQFVNILCFSYPCGLSSSFKGTQYWSNCDVSEINCKPHFSPRKLLQQWWVLLEIYSMSPLFSIS